MIEIIAVVKNKEIELPIPSTWRNTICTIVESLCADTFIDVENVQTPSTEDLQYFRDNITDYGATLIALPKETWNSSMYLFMEDYWEAFVDVYTQEEGLSDLVMSLRVHESSEGYQFEIQSIHVL